MTATFRFYAELNDFLPPGRRYRAFEHRFLVPGSVKDMIETLGAPHTEVDLILVNGQSVDFACQVRDGDRVSVYPMFEALDIAPLARVRPEPLREPRFVLDTHLGRLATYLRMMGFDSHYEKHAGDEGLARISAGERRILLTRDRGLLKRAAVTHGYYVRETNPRRQLAEILDRFDLRRLARPLERCLRCNVPIQPVAKAEILDRVPARTAELYAEFFTCPRCRRVYWKGGHWRRMSERIIAHNVSHDP